MDGKADREFFEAHVAGRLGADRDDVSLGPAHGVDFGVARAGDTAVVAASDPLFVDPTLGLERAAWFAVHVALADAAVSGLPPTHLCVDLNLPPGTTGEAFDRLWSVFDRETRDLGVAVLTGHTGTYEGCSWPTVGGATALAVGDPAEVVRPDGARAGDRLIVTKGPAVEATGLLAARREDLDLPEAALDRFEDATVVRDAPTAAAAGPVTAMHDATERGVLGGLHELAAAASVELRAERDRVPVLPGVRETCAAAGIDPWTASSEGSLLATVAPEGVEQVLAALDREGVPAAEVGEVCEGTGVVLDGERTDPPTEDPFWPAYTGDSA
jgi:hydrogenase expression/formation protein HypE